MTIEQTPLTRSTLRPFGLPKTFQQCSPHEYPYLQALITGEWQRARFPENQDINSPLTLVAALLPQIGKANTAFLQLGAFQATNFLLILNAQHVLTNRHIALPHKQRFLGSFGQALLQIKSNDIGAALACRLLAQYPRHFRLNLHGNPDEALAHLTTPAVRLRYFEKAWEAGDPFTYIEMLQTPAVASLITPAEQLLCLQDSLARIEDYQTLFNTSPKSLDTSQFQQLIRLSSTGVNQKTLQTYQQKALRQLFADNPVWQLYRSVLRSQQNPRRGGENTTHFQRLLTLLQTPTTTADNIHAHLQTARPTSTFSFFTNKEDYRAQGLLLIRGGMSTLRQHALAVTELLQREPLNNLLALNGKYAALFPKQELQQLQPLQQQPVEIQAPTAA